MFHKEKIVEIKNWNKHLFSFKTSREPSVKFNNGEFVMLGLDVNGTLIKRPYSFVNPNWSDYLEFYSIKIPEGPFSSALTRLNVGDDIQVGDKSTGSLLTSNLKPGSDLWLLCTGTGVAPFISIIQDFDIWKNYNQVILLHSCRKYEDLSYAEMLLNFAKSPLFSDFAEDKFVYRPTITQEPSYFTEMGRITSLLENKQFYRRNNLSPITKKDSRVMICGNPEFTLDMIARFKGLGMTAGSNQAPGEFLYEKAFVEK